MNKKYEKPQAEIHMFSANDSIMTTSADGFTVKGDVAAGQVEWNSQWTKAINE